ncbi:MAG: outer membrane beta-barrel protein [Desulfobacteraceae bacterium]|nr:outer membrane beta-barrel protein [Desulfobacteraceae bacterium]
MVLLLPAAAASGRQAILTGSVSLLNEYDSNVGLTETAKENGWFTTLSPSLVLTSEGPRDKLSFGYAPALRYHHENGGKQVDHFLTLDGSKQFSRRFSMEVRESFMRSNDYTYYVREYVEQPGAGIPLSADRTRSDYWTNGVTVAANYEYAEKSFLKGGYTNQILENDSPSVDDHVQHHPYLSVTRQLNHQWETELSYDYLKGDFRVSPDLDEHRLGALLNFLVNPHDLVFGSYQYTTLNYERDRSGYDLHRGDIGWQRGLGPETAMAASVGVSYADLESGRGETAFDYAAEYTRKINHGSFKVAGKGGMEELQFDAITQGGLSRFWSVRGDVDYQLTAGLSSQPYLLYREDTFIEASPHHGEKSLVGGLSLTYAFWRWYAIAAGYSYRQLDSELPGNSYDDHRIYVQLNAGKELKRWL